MKKTLFFAGIFLSNSIFAQIYTPNGSITGASSNGSTGYVGIGISTPESKLTVHDNGFTSSSPNINVYEPGEYTVTRDITETV